MQASEKARQRISEFGEQHSKEEEDENDDQSSSSEGKSVNTKIKVGCINFSVVKVLCLHFSYCSVLLLYSFCFNFLF